MDRISIKTEDYKELVKKSTALDLIFSQVSTWDMGTMAQNLKDIMVPAVEEPAAEKPAADSSEEDF